MFLSGVEFLAALVGATLLFFVSVCELSWGIGTWGVKKGGLDVFFVSVPGRFASAPLETLGKFCFVEYSEE